MNFYSKRRKRPAVPIVTLIDILAILLIFFIVTTTFKKRESLVKVNLPRSSELEGAGDPTERRVPLAIGNDGQVSLGETIVPIGRLAAALREFKANRPEAELELKADEGAPLGLMVEVWDAASAAGLDIGDLPLRILLEE